MADLGHVVPVVRGAIERLEGRALGVGPRSGRSEERASEEQGKARHRGGLQRKGCREGKKRGEERLPETLEDTQAFRLEVACDETGGRVVDAAPRLRAGACRDYMRKGLTVAPGRAPFLRSRGDRTTPARRERGDRAGPAGRP